MLLDQHQIIFGYLNLTLSPYNVLGNNDNLANNHLYHYIHDHYVFSAFFTGWSKKVFLSIITLYENFAFHIWKKIYFVTSSSVCSRDIFKFDTKIPFILWKFGSNKLPKYWFRDAVFEHANFHNLLWEINYHLTVENGSPLCSNWVLL